MADQLRSADAIVTQFNLTVRDIINRIEKKSRSNEELANLDRLKKRVSLLKQTMGPAALVTESTPFFLKYSERILETDEKIREDFFMNLDVRGEYMRSKKTNSILPADEFVFALTDSVRGHWRRATVREKSDVYEDVKNMLTCCIEHKLVTSD